MSLVFRCSRFLGGPAARALCLLALAVGTGARADFGVSVTAGDHVVDHMPVTLALPADIEPDAVVLTDKATGKPVPFQADTTAEGAPAITWVTGTIEPGTSHEYLLTRGKPKAAQQGVELAQTKFGLGIRIDGEPFSTYQIKAGPKPYLWPILGPTGKPVTRAYPMRSDVPGERDDHEHHRSLWFTYDNLNGENFWHEAPSADEQAVTRHRAFSGLASGPVFGEFTSTVDWLGKDGDKVAEDERTIRVWRLQNARLIDFDLTLKATNGPIEIKDSKEGMFAVRVAGTMKVDQKGRMKVDQGKPTPPSGVLVNANGERDTDAWGKRAPWADYYGPIDGETVGIAIFDHPKNFRHPTYWHARTYGLFAANPFGVSYFTGDKSNDGSITIPEGEEMRFRYRVLVHEGTTEEADVAAWYAAYADPPKVAITPDS